MKQIGTNLLANEKPIIALCTPRGSGAIALLRLCGVGSIEIADKISQLSSKKNLSDVETHTIHHGYILDFNIKNKPLTKNLVEQRRDEVLFFVMKGSKTFTGQDTVEISCHNNQFIIQSIIEQAILAGAKIAKAGEFTQRAFLNNKIDLIQAESINDLINAQTEIALKKSFSQLQGSLSKFLVDIENKLLDLLGLVEGSFEFFEEEKQDFDIDKLFKSKFNQIMVQLELIKKNFNQQQQIKNGIKISLIGWVNSGKSTLFNKLLNQDRSIVTSKEGTTRDVVESNLYNSGNFWLLSDTAGLRNTNDVIEQEGINRTYKQAAISDIVLLVIDSSVKLSKKQIEIYKELIKNYRNKIIFVESKIDVVNHRLLNYSFINEILKNEASGKIISVSSINNIGIDLLKQKIEEKIQNLFENFESPFLLNQRQYNLIIELIEELKAIELNCSDIIEYELVAYHLKHMLETISELTGKNITEKVLDKVFNEFCIGK